jgi:hypothetical protein
MLGLLLFAVFERRRIAVWRRNFRAMLRKRTDERANSSLLTKLADAGFLDGLSTEDAQRVRNSIQASGYGGVFEHPWRAFNADDEELAEGHTGPFLLSLAPAFEQLGLAPVIGESRFIDGGAHLLDLPNETITLISDEEIKRDNPRELSRYCWGAVAARLLDKLNAHLVASGTAERFYSVYGGNDAFALLLNPRMLSAIMETPGVRQDELPYIRTAVWPDFGMGRRR